MNVSFPDLKLDNLNKLIDVLKSVEERDFNMGSFISYVDDGVEINTDEDMHNCGTAACIAGYIVAMELETDLTTLRQVRYHELSTEKMTQAHIALQDKLVFGGGIDFAGKGAAFLGIGDFEADRLFIPRGDYKPFTRPVAIRVLENLRDKGEIDWYKAVDEIAVEDAEKGTV